MEDSNDIRLANEEPRAYWIRKLRFVFSFRSLDEVRAAFQTHGESNFYSLTHIQKLLRDPTWRQRLELCLLEPMVHTVDQVGSDEPVYFAESQFVVDCFLAMVIGTEAAMETRNLLTRLGIDILPPTDHSRIVDDEEES